MNFKNSPRKSLKINIGICIIILTLLLIINFIPNEFEKFKYGFKIENSPALIWKNICYIIIGILVIIQLIVNFAMCRCKYCKKHIKHYGQIN